MIPAAFAPLASHLWQSTVFAAVAGLLTLALRCNQARARYWLWAAASYKFLLPFSWLVSIGHQFHLRTAPAIMPSAFSTVTDVVSGPIFLTALPNVKPAPDHLHALLFAIVAVWACGFVVVATACAREWLRIRAIAHAASPLFLGLPIRVVSTPARLEPGVFGIFHPVLLLPEGIATRLTPAQLQAVLAHELCHVRRRDNLTAMIHMLVEAIFWFYPLLWWLGARMIDERERACDEEVLQAGSQAKVYAESILKVCEFYLESPLSCVSGVTGSDLKQRIQRIMKERFGVPLSAQKKLLLAMFGVAVLAVPLVVGVLRLQAQSRATVPQWITAGGKMAFDVASVKLDTTAPSPETVHWNIPPDSMGAFNPTGGLYSATNMPLVMYIAFAYKLAEPEANSLRNSLPKWTNTVRFDVEAHASAGLNPTKDQFRLMMQALLADRFKLAAHFETKEMPVMALVLDKPGKLGPRLQPHETDAPCSTAPPTFKDGLPITVAGGFPEWCGTVSGWRESGLLHVGGRDLDLESVVKLLSVQSTGIDRPVLDRTGLMGKYDLMIEFTPAFNSPPGAEPQFDQSGPTFQEALKEQLGLKLVPQTGPVDVLVIDHAEEPSAN